MSPPALRPLRVWDLPTRLFHWLLAASVVASVVSAKIGGNAMGWHLRLGALALALLLFRAVWGLVGGHWSRFAQFAYGPAGLLADLRGRSPALHQVGHSPRGSLSVWAMLGVLAAQVATGLVADDEIATTGPLNRFVSSTLAGRASAWHAGPGQWLVIGLVLLHVAAVLVYLRRGRNLIGTMWHGDRLLPADVPASSDGLRERLRALLVALACAALAFAVHRLGA